MKSISLFALFTVCSVTAIAQNGVTHPPGYGLCLALNEAAITLVASGHLDEAEASLTARAFADERSQLVCRGQVLTNMARAMGLQGRIAEAERLARDALRTLEKVYPPDDWALLRPLQVIAVVRLEAGKTAAARSAVARIQSIRIKDLDDAAIVHGVVGTLLHTEGRRSEAEAEYDSALRALEERGRRDSTDAATILTCLAALYVAEGRFDESRRILDRALRIHDRAKDTLPMDYVKFFYLRGVFHIRAGEWQEAEEDLHHAISLADRQPYGAPAFLPTILDNYSYVLRKNHRRQEAKVIKARAAALPRDRTAAAIVDSSALLVGKGTAKY